MYSTTCNQKEIFSMNQFFDSLSRKVEIMYLNFYVLRIIVIFPHILFLSGGQTPHILYWKSPVISIDLRLKRKYSCKVSCVLEYF